MYCTNCGNELPPGATACPSCGTRVPHFPPPPQVPNYLVHSIIATLCCCMPFGIVALVYSAQVNSKLAAGDVRSKIMALPGVKDAEVEVVFDPVWDRSMMSEAARLQLGMMW